MRPGPRLQLLPWLISCQSTGYPGLFEAGKKGYWLRSSELRETSTGGQDGLWQGDLSPQVSVVLLLVKVPIATGALSLPLAASRGSHPVDCELPDDDSRTKGAGWVHGAAGEVDLGSECRSGREEAEGRPGRGQCPPPWLRAPAPGLASVAPYPGPGVRVTALAPRLEGSGKDTSSPSGPLQPPQGGTSGYMGPVSPLPLTPMRWPTATEAPIVAAGEPVVCLLSVEAKTQSTSCRVRTSSTATAWPVETLLRTCARGLHWSQRALPGAGDPLGLISSL